MKFPPARRASICVLFLFLISVPISISIAAERPKPLTAGDALTDGVLKTVKEHFVSGKLESTSVESFEWTENGDHCLARKTRSLWEDRFEESCYKKISGKFLKTSYKVLLVEKTNTGKNSFPIVEIDYEYNEKGNLVKERSNIGMPGENRDSRVLEFSHDDAGRMISRKEIENGKTVECIEYEHSKTGDVETITGRSRQCDDENPVSRETNIFDSNGKLIEKRFVLLNQKNPLEESAKVFSYDKKGRVTNLKTTDKANEAQQGELWVTMREEEEIFEYDSKGRLASVTKTFKFKNSEERERTVYSYK